MSLLATSLKKSKPFSLRRKAITPAIETLAKLNRPSPQAPVLPSPAIGADSVFYEGLPLDLFDIGNELGQRVIEALYSAIEDAQAQGVTLLPAMPTVIAYRVETEILTAIGEGSITEERLQTLVVRYIETHSGDALGSWTDRSVPLFYMTIKEGSKVVEGYSANYIQVCIIRELWLRTSPEATFDLIRL